MMRVRELPSNLYATPAYVFCGERLAGQLVRGNAGSRFIYDLDYLERPNTTAVAWNLPKSMKEKFVGGMSLPSYFANLLPEGWVLAAVAERIKTSTDDLLSLLIALGRDTIGDVWLDWESEPPPAQTEKEWNLKESTFEDILTEQYANPTRPPEPFSIAGVQEKVSANRITIIGVRSKGHPAIIKVNRNTLRYPRLVENEAFFMELATKCGILAPRVKVIHDASGDAGLWVERFDRTRFTDNRFERLHQEDICQLTDRYPKDKYNLSAAIVVATLAEVCSAPIIETMNFLRLFAYSWLIGNGDLHGKNLSVLWRTDGLRVLSPGYDLLTTVPYKDRTMAFRMDGKDANFSGKDFVHFGKRHGLPEAAIRNMINKLIKPVANAIPSLPKIGFDQKATQFLAIEMERRVARVADFA